MADSMENPNDVIPIAGDNPIPTVHPTREEFRQIKASAKAIAHLYNELSSMAEDDGEITVKVDLLFDDMFALLKKLGIQHLHLLQCFYAQYINEFREFPDAK